MKKKSVHNTLELCNRAAEIIKGIGFQLRHTSLKTEACYYALPERGNDVLRIAAHSNPGPRDYHNNLTVVAKLTFTGNCHDRPGEIRLAGRKFEDMLARAVGAYMLNTSPMRVRSSVDRAQDSES